MDFTTKEATATMVTTDIIEATAITEEESTAGEKGESLKVYVKPDQI